VISFNKIEKNKRNGVVCRSYKKFLCKAIIKKNLGIAGNKENGILIEGENNKTQVVSNHMIGFNE
jgi:phage terminase large subunit-like protein